MTPKVFRLGKFRRWYILIVSVLGCGALIWLMALYAQFASKNESFSLLLIPFGGITLFLVVLCGYMIWMTWSYRIEFLEKELRVARYGIPFVRPFRCLYEDIVYVRRPIMKGSIEITPKNGKPFQFPIIVEGGSDAVMDEFEKLIPMGKTQPFLRDELRKYSRQDMARYGFAIFIFVVLLLQWSPRIVLPLVAWETEWGTFFLPSSHVNNYWIEDDGTAWVSVMDIGTTAQVIRIGADGQKTWKLEDDKNVLYADAIVAGSSEQPWLIHRDKLLHWVDTSWQASFLEGYKILPARSVVEENIFWAPAFQGQQPAQFLMKLNLDTGEIEWIQIPGQLIQDAFFVSNIKTTPDGAIVVSLMKKDHPEIYFYSYKNGQWINSYSLDNDWSLPEWVQASPNIAQPFLRYEDFTIDYAGQIWVIYDLNGQPVIGRFNSSMDHWEWSYVESECNLCSISYRDLVVDEQGRIWLEVEYGIRRGDTLFVDSFQPFGLDVFMPRWGDVAEHVTHYTNYNSNYQVGIDNTGLKLSPDGRVWVAGDRLVWIDSRSAKLPNKMPEWFATTINPLILMIVYLVGLALFVVLFVSMWVIKLIRKRRTT